MIISQDTIILIWLFAKHFLANTFIALLFYLFDERFHLELKVFLAVNVIISTILTIIRFYVNTGKAIDIFVNTLYGIRGRANWTLREQLECKLTQVRYFKMKKQFDKALSIADEVIREDAEFPDALFLKAQILWEGFEDVDAAKTYLEKVMEVAPDENDCIHRWASNLYDKLA